MIFNKVTTIIIITHPLNESILLVYFLGHFDSVNDEY